MFVSHVVFICDLALSIKNLSKMCLGEYFTQTFMFYNLYISEHTLKIKIVLVLCLCMSVLRFLLYIAMLEVTVKNDNNNICLGFDIVLSKGSMPSICGKC